MDKATITAHNSIAKRKRKREILERLEEKEFIQRCNAVGMCYKCGKDWEDVGSMFTHHTVYACQNKKCSEYDIVKKHIYPNRKEE